MPSQEEIYTRVSATLVEALNVDDEEIKPRQLFAAPTTEEDT
jgi:hypothetical protein